MNKEQLIDALGELDCGNFIEKIAAQLSETAMSVLHTDGKKKGEVTIKLSLSKVGNSDQLIIESAMAHKTPTKRGHKSEIDTTETPMFVGKGGVLSITQPREELSGQYSLQPQSDGIRHFPKAQ